MFSRSLPNINIYLVQFLNKQKTEKCIRGPGTIQKVTLTSLNFKTQHLHPDTSSSDSLRSFSHPKFNMGIFSAVMELARHL